MARKRYSTEQIIGMLRQAKIELKGTKVGLICKQLGVTPNTYYRRYRDTKPEWDVFSGASDDGWQSDSLRSAAKKARAIRVSCVLKGPMCTYTTRKMRSPARLRT